MMMTRSLINWGEHVLNVLKILSQTTFCRIRACVRLHLIEGL